MTPFFQGWIDKLHNCVEGTYFINNGCYEYEKRTTSVTIAGVALSKAYNLYIETIKLSWLDK